MVFQVIDLSVEQRVVVIAQGCGTALCPTVRMSMRPSSYFLTMSTISAVQPTRTTPFAAQQHAEWRLGLQTVAHHSAVARFEYVQGSCSPGKQDDVEWKKRNAFRPHGSQPKGYQKVLQNAARRPASGTRLESAVQNAESVSKRQQTSNLFLPRLAAESLQVPLNAAIGHFQCRQNWTWSCTFKSGVVRFARFASAGLPSVRDDCHWRSIRVSAGFIETGRGKGCRLPR